MSSLAVGQVGTDGLRPRARWAIERAAYAFERMLGPEGNARCPEHGVDHTGKTARAIVLNCALASDREDDPFLERAIRVAQIITGRLGQDEAANGAWVFFPGLHDARNVSTNVIDCGECIDALATLLMVAGSRLPDVDRARIEDAVYLCADSYLAPTAPRKPVINQRLWGAMGLASASAVFGESRWADSVREAVATAIEEMRPDGSFPYVTEASDIGEHEGISDLTVYYHSRVVAFARYALDRIGDGNSHAEQLRQAVDFLVDILRPDGVKPLALEGKRWFWEADSEAGSAAYDAYALATDGRPATRKLAGIVAARSAQTVGPDGLVDASPGQPAFVCRVFHTADLVWLARAHAAAELDDLPANPLILEQRPLVHHAEAGVVRIQTRRVCALIRTSKRPANGLVGGRIAGGGLIYVGNAETGWSNALSDVCEPWMPEATWFLSSTANAAPKSLDAATRFRLHVARMHWRAGRRRYALRMIYRLLGPPAWAAEWQFASMHALDSDVKPIDDGVTIGSWLAQRDGTVLQGLQTRRCYRVDGGRLVVHDMVMADEAVGDLVYRYPRATDLFEVNAPTSWHVVDHQVRFGPLAGGATASIHYEI